MLTITVHSGENHSFFIFLFFISNLRYSLRDWSAFSNPKRNQLLKYIRWTGMSRKQALLFSETSSNIHTLRFVADDSLAL